MKVRELIKKLQSANPDAEVYAESYHNTSEKASNVMFALKKFNEVKEMPKFGCDFDFQYENEVLNYHKQTAVAIRIS